MTKKIAICNTVILNFISFVVGPLLVEDRRKINYEREFFEKCLEHKDNLKKGKKENKIMN
jgi:hypothetical protein